MIPTEILQAIIFAIGNIVGIGIASWLLIDRKIDKKLAKYANNIKNSPEGKDLFALLKEGKEFLESEEVKNLMREFTAGMEELRGFLKKLREKAEASVEEDDGEGKPLLPSLGE